MSEPESEGTPADDTRRSSDARRSGDAQRSGDEKQTRGEADGPFSLGALRELVELMEKHGLTEVSLKNGETQWKLRRGPEQGGYAPPPVAYAPAPAASAPQAAPAPAPQAAAPAAPSGPVIKSPTVGTFYAAASPDDPPYVTVGSRVQPDTIVCQIEAMKVFNQIPAEVSGVIAEVLVKNGDSVEFGQPLFRITPG